MAQKDSWSVLTDPGDWVLEERRNPKRKPTYHLCLLGPDRKEQTIDEPPTDLFKALVDGGVIPISTEGWED